MKKNVIIVGMARSGTSFTASLFAHNGYFVADNHYKLLGQADKFNPSGYWEAESILNCNKDILSAVGFQHDNTWFHSPITDEQSSGILKLETFTKHKKLIDTYNENQPWVWKDPRFCYTLGYWWPLLEKSNTGILLLKRDPDEIYNSFLRISDSWDLTIKMDKDEVFERINNHIQSAEILIEKFKIPHIVVNYSDYSNNPRQCIQKINNFFGTSFDYKQTGFKARANHSSFTGKILFIYEIMLNKLVKLLHNFKNF